MPLGKETARSRSEAAPDLGLKAGMPVAQGGIDAYLGMLGMGATRRRRRGDRRLEHVPPRAVA